MNQALSMVWQVLSLQATEGIHLVVLQPFRPHSICRKLIHQLPFVCRLLALLLAAPFAICIVLDIIAYAIVRTLHLSMSQQRIPRSPLHASAMLESDMEPISTHADAQSPSLGDFTHGRHSTRSSSSASIVSFLSSTGYSDSGLSCPENESPSAESEAKL